MKKLLIILIILLPLLNLNANTAYAKESFDDTFNNIINGINEENYVELNDLLNSFFNEDISFKDRIIKFLKGEVNFDFNLIKSVVFLKYSNLKSVLLKVLIYVLIIGIICSLSNIIISKNNGNIANNTIFYICYILVITILTKLIYELFSEAKTTLNEISKNTELLFPLMFTISSLCGNFGVSLYKPFTCFVSFFSSSISTNYLLPLILFGTTILIISNLNENIKITNLAKSIFSLFKWIIGLILIVYTFILSIQGIVNSSYNGISVKILKYTTGSMVPIVGGFLSGGIDVLLSSAILVKNSIGLIAVVYLLLKIGSVFIWFLISSFIVKFSVSICEPILDKRFVSILNGVSDVFKYLASLIGVCSYMYFITVLGFIFSTISVI